MRKIRYFSYTRPLAEIKMGAIKNIIRKIDPLVKPFHSYSATIFPYYHTVSNEDLPHIKGLYSFKNEKEFMKDLDFLLKKYKILEPSKMVKSILTGNKIPSNSFLLSFDDGLSEVYQTILPILNQKGIPAIFFINSKYIDNPTLFYKHKISIIVQHLATNKNDDCTQKFHDILSVKQDSVFNLIQKIKSLNYKEDNKLDELLEVIGVDQSKFLKTQQPYLTFSELNEIKNKGHYIGGHTVNHFPLDQLSINQQAVEILDSIVWLKDNFDIEYELFSFPFSDAFASKTLFDKLFSEMPNLICMGNQGMTKDISDQIVQRFSLEKENRADVGVRMNIIYNRYLSLIGKGKLNRKTL